MQPVRSALLSQLLLQVHECFQLQLQWQLRCPSSKTLGLHRQQRCEVLREPWSMQELLLLLFRHRQHRRSSLQLP